MTIIQPIRSMPLLHSIFTHPFGRSRPVFDAPSETGQGGSAEQMPTPTPDPLAELVASVAALRTELAELKAKPEPTPAPTPVTVPPTDQGRPTITPITPDLSSLSPIARMAAGYRK